MPQPNLAISRQALKEHVKEAVRGSVEAEWARAMVNKDWGPRVKPKCSVVSCSCYSV